MWFYMSCLDGCSTEFRNFPNDVWFSLTVSEDFLWFLWLLFPLFWEMKITHIYIKLFPSTLLLFIELSLWVLHIICCGVFLCIALLDIRKTIVILVNCSQHYHIVRGCCFQEPPLGGGWGDLVPFYMTSLMWIFLSSCVFWKHWILNSCDVWLM
jgi:hypothetical protein